MDIKSSEREPKRGGSLWSFLGGMFAGALLVAVLAGGVYLVKNIVTYVRNSSGRSESEEIVNGTTLNGLRLLEEVVDNYFYQYKEDAVSAKDMQNGIYKGFIKALNDPYSEYYTKEELEEALNDNMGITYGIGAYISLNTERNMAMIAGVMEDSPAEAAGLQEGDLIYKVDGEDMVGISTSAVVARVKGQENTTVHLTIIRQGESQYLEFDIVRGKLLETNTVIYGTILDAEHLGYLRIQEFDVVTRDQFNEAMADLKAEGIQGLVLDLRSNPGGDLNAVVEIARRILPEGLILYTEDKNGRSAEYYCDGENELQIPMVVLVNSYTASAAEILAGAIQDYNKGTLVGTTTFGKGIVQRIIRLENGAAVKLTISAYYLPSGKNIQGTGIEPDIILEYDAESNETDGIDNQVEKAIEILEGKIK